MVSERRNSRNKLLIVLIMLLIISINGIQNMIQSDVEENNEVKSFNLNSISFIDHAPIYIVGDDELIDYANNEGLSGDGSISKPYIIEGLNIRGSSILIEIHNVSLSFKIFNNILNGVPSTPMGIELTNVTTSVIENNTLEEGIKIIESQYMIVSNNYINTSYWGIELQYSDYNSIVNNTLINSNNGLYLHTSHFNRVDFNNVTSNYYSLYLLYSNNNIITGNRLETSSPSFGTRGLNPNLSNNNNFTDNIVSDKTYGIYLRNWAENNIYKSNILLNNEYGLEVEAFDNRKKRLANFSFNYFINNQYGTRLSIDAENMNITMNDYFGNTIDALDNGTSNIFSKNYWGTHSSTADMNSDGYVDDPFYILGSSNNVDMKPRVNQLDMDSDNLPDIWEILNGLNHKINDANEDPDNDGVSNYDEYLNGTDPQVSDITTTTEPPTTTSTEPSTTTTTTEPSTTTSTEPSTTTTTTEPSTTTTTESPTTITEPPTTTKSSSTTEYTKTTSTTTTTISIPQVSPGLTSLILLVSLTVFILLCRKNERN